MEQYISKAALVAEIERLYQEHSSKEYIDEGGVVLCQLEDFLDTLEVKEVDLEEEIDKFINSKEVWEIQEEPVTTIEDAAKHFFELGMQASNPLTWEDINLIDHLLFDIKEDYDNGKLDKEEYYKEVLKKFKAQL